MRTWIVSLVLFIMVVSSLANPEVVEKVNKVDNETIFLHPLPIGEICDRISTLQNHRTRRDLNVICPKLSILGCLIKLDFLIPSRLNFDFNDLLDRLKGASGPQEIDYQQLKNAQLDLELAKIEDLRIRRKHEHHRRRLEMRRLILQAREYRTFSVICDLIASSLDQY